MGYGDLDDVRIAEEIGPPDRLEDLSTGQNPPRIFEEVNEQLKLFAAKLQPTAAARRLVRVSNDRHVGEAQCAVVSSGWARSPAPQQRPQPSEQLLQGEGLREVIVGPR